MNSAIEIATLVRLRDRSAREVVQEALGRIEEFNSRINAFVVLDAAGALKAADRIDQALAKGGDPGPFAGVPIGVKDNEDCIGMPTSNGSVFFRGRAPAQADSFQVARLRRAGAIPVGKTAAAEFGMDGVTHTIAWGTTRNPWNLERTPSGSSGGSAAAVSAGLVPLSTASDGGGSTRVPAAFTGLVGLKPTHGRIPRSNGASDINSPGALTMTVADTARYVDVVSGPDDHDRMSLPKPSMSFEALIESLKVRGLTAVWSTDMGFAPVEPEVESAARDAARALADGAGLRLMFRDVRFTNTYIDWARLASHRLRIRLQRDGLYPDRAADISPGPRALLERFGSSTETELLAATERLFQLEREVAEFFEDADILLTPTAACVAYRAEGPLPTVVAGRDASDTNGEPFTGLANICWNPSVSVPAGVGADGLPVGLMITGRRHYDEIVLRLARILEQVSGWPRGAPGFN